MMMDGYTTYDSITTKTTTEEDVVASPTAARSVAARLVGILVGAVVLVALATTTMDLSSGLGSMVSLRSNDSVDPQIPQMMPDGGEQIPQMGPGGGEQIPQMGPQVQGSNSQCHWCTYNKCATGVLCVGPDANACTKCNFRKCNLFTNCA